MPTRLLTQKPPLAPWSVLTAVLVVIFVSEFGVMVVLPWLMPSDWTPLTEAFLDACLLTFVMTPLLWYLIVLPLQRQAAQRALLIRRLIEGQEEQLGRVARDLHDGLGQYLTTFVVGLRTIEELTSLDEARKRAHELRRIGAEAHDEIRRLTRGLRPTILDDLGLASALERYLQELRDAHGLETHLTLDGSTSVRCGLPIETALYRIVQEATSNAVRHGRARHVDVALRYADDRIDLTVTDDGGGFDVEAVLQRTSNAAPFGLLGIRQRAEDLRGTASVTSVPGGGTVVRVSVPLAEAAT